MRAWTLLRPLPPLIALAALGGGTALGGPTTSPPPPTTTAPPVAAKPPVLSSLRLPRVVTARQGHGRFLVGVSTSTASRVRVQLVNAATKRLVRTVIAADVHPAGRVYVMVEAVTDQRFQLPAGNYQVTVQATDARGRPSNAFRRPLRLNYRVPRGRLDAVTVPLWPSLARQHRLRPGGQLVATVAPGGVAVKAGMRRGDIIRSIGGVSVETPGGLARALRVLNANASTIVEVDRGGQILPFAFEMPPDWEATPKFTPSLAVAARRERSRLGYSYARARDLAENDDAAAARKAVRKWRSGWRKSAAAHLLLADMLFAEGKNKQALGAYNRARVADPNLADAWVGRGLMLTELGKPDPALESFARAAELDPRDAATRAYMAFAALRSGAERAAEALAHANRAIALDRENEEGHIARGLALIAAGRTKDGVTALKRGLLLLEDPERVQELITDSLEPNDP